MVSGSVNQVDGSVRQRAMLILLCLVLLLGIWQQAGMLTLEPVFPVDDAYITLQNANELLGGESAFRDAEKLSGATSIGHTLLVAILILLTQNDLLALSLTSLLGGLVYLLGMTELARCYTDKLTNVVAVVIAAALLADAAHQLANGLETSWGMAVVAWALALFSRNTVLSTRLLCVLLGVMPFVRPELIALSGLLAGLLGYRFYAGNKDPELIRQFVITSAGFAILGALPFLLANLLLTGAAVPNTISAKKAFFAEGCREFVWKWSSLKISAGWLFQPEWMMTLGLIGLIKNNLGRVLLAFVIIFYAAYFSSFTGALGHYEGRYQYLLLPMIVLGLLNVLVWMRGLAQPYADSFGAVVIIIAALFFTGPAGLELANTRRAFTQEHLYPVAGWLNRNISAEQTVLIHDAGYVGYAIDEPVLDDLVGLKTPGNIKYHEQITWPSCGAERYLAVGAIFLESQPDLIVVYEVWDRIFGITSAYRAVGGQLELLLQTGEDGYSIYKVNSSD